MTMLQTIDFERLSAAHAAARAPDAIFRAVEAVIRERIGFGLLTMLMLAPDGDEVGRVYTTDAVHYPLAGRERLGSTPWGDHVLRQGLPYLGRDRAAVAWAFPGDFALIESLGLGATMNVPVRLPGRVLGSMNILDAEHRFDQRHFSAAC